jgi:catechol 2,3-dioxygenase-like lactoylglutathione lyase family enzyme
MNLADARLTASIAVSDMATATRFYEEKLGLSAVREQADGSRIYDSRGGAGLHVYPSPASAGKTAGTQATWYVEDLEAIVDGLTASGVAFEQYDDPPIKTNEKGIAGTAGDGTVAWLKDPDGNTLAIEQSSEA